MKNKDRLLYDNEENNYLCGRNPYESSIHTQFYPMKTNTMWTKPWTLKEGFSIGAAVIVAGLILELCTGPVNWSVFAWPVNIVTLSLLVLAIMVMRLLHRRVYAFRFLGTLQAAIPTITYAVGLTIIMGLTRQSEDGYWFNNMLSFWPFVLIYLLMAIILGLTVLKQLLASHFSLLGRAKRSPSGVRLLTPRPSLLFHLGLFIVLTTATLGNADIRQLRMVTVVGQADNRALDKENRIVNLPLAIELHRFIMETYDDGSPKRYASDIQIYTKSGKNIRTTIDVNKPAKIEGWKIYQYGYDAQMGAASQYSILELVRDPWLPYVYAGIGMMLLGALLTLIGRERQRTKNIS